MNKSTIMQTSSFEDTPYDPHDEEAVADFWEGATITHKGKVLGTATRAQQRELIKVPVSIPLSPDVLEYFRSGGEGWQGRLDDALRTYITEHDKAA